MSEADVIKTPDAAAVEKAANIAHLVGFEMHQNFPVYLANLAGAYNDAVHTEDSQALFDIALANAQTGGNAAMMLQGAAPRGRALMIEATRRCIIGKQQSAIAAAEKAAADADALAALIGAE